MTAVKLTIHGTGTGSCSLTGKEGEGLTVSFEDGTIREAFLSTRAFMQLMRLKAGTAKAEPRPEPKPTPQPPVQSGPAAAPK